MFLDARIQWLDMPEFNGFVVVQVLEEMREVR